MVTHLLDDDLSLVATGELFGPDLLHAGEHFSSCAECRERAAVWITRSGSDVVETFFEDVERTIAHAESGGAPIRETIAKLQTMELALYAAAGTVELSSCGLNRRRARVLFCQAWLLFLNGSLAPSREAAIRAREISASLGDEVQVARALVVESLALGDLLETAAAVATAREAGAIFARHDEQRRARIARGAEASVLVVADRHAEAAEIYHELLAVAGPDDPDRLHWLNDLAMCLKELGELDRAEEIELTVLASPGIASETALGARWVCAVVQARRGNFEDALERLRLVKADAHALERRSLEMVASYTMAEVLSALDRPQEAAAMAKDVIAYFTEENLPSQARGAMALLREALGRGEASLFDELENFRQTFPELFPHAPALRSSPSRQVS